MLQKIKKWAGKILWSLLSSSGATVFPGALDAYSTKNAGDVIQEGHVNDVQDAVEATEAKVGVDASAIATSLDYKVNHLLGAWDAGAPWAPNTVYLAATDGFVTAYGTGGTPVTIDIWTDANNPPTTKRLYISVGGGQVTAMCPVKKGHYWKVVDAASGATIFWIPLGS